MSCTACSRAWRNRERVGTGECNIEALRLPGLAEARIQIAHANAMPIPCRVNGLPVGPMARAPASKAAGGQQDVGGHRTSLGPTREAIQPSATSAPSVTSTRSTRWFPGRRIQLLATL